MNKLKKTALQHISCYFMLCINGYINRHINTEGYIHTCDYTETHKGNAVVMVRHLLLCSGSSFCMYGGASVHGVKNEMDNKIQLILLKGFAVRTLQVFILEGSKSAAKVKIIYFTYCIHK